MREHPILFSSEMVRRLLDGTKTQTRRPCKLANPRSREAVSLCPYGKPGDRLWVRETWYYDGGDTRDVEPDERDLRLLEYRADHDCRSWEAGCPCNDENERSSWRPSIHMPRWACRLSLEITGVRIERLHDISEKDANAEGVAIPVDATDCPPGMVKALHQLTRSPMLHAGIKPTAKNAYRWAYACLWEQLNGKRAPWSSNPWVWVLSFKRVEATQKAVDNG